MMSKKIDQLLKKITSFEKLSTCFDRTSFLQTLAQSAQREPISFQKTSPSETRSSADFERTSPNGGFDPALISKYENLDEFGNPIQTGIPPVPPSATFDNPTPADSYNMKPVNIIGNYSPIAPETQQILSELTGMPLTPDGKLGPKTQQALNAFKTKYNLPSNYSDKE